MRRVWIKVNPWSKEKGDAVLLLRETGGSRLGQLVEEPIEEN